ncbi:hypothetical protein MPTK1_2g00390 [Marchantia polymorpha subsp. ruderalis]|uniref:Uncharacterized protein n=1 Tax=Marchantia polymorpha TaxID=3197 RepID=A0A2R6X9Q6_MARPO|nr:hypothetical protein MARPO_0028s0112 [Marchantia polymorpha]BBN00578.1 hypothetical protein Mp_2g00390 [Marchantia polymorpha subsp. ruderalis]|eukprot:PTQ42819.1 hypothetical protein MARPO_0028s0112 [Marchantia polymorpha]
MRKTHHTNATLPLGYGFPIGDPWITYDISPWRFAFESVHTSQCLGIYPMHYF